MPCELGQPTRRRLARSTDERTNERTNERSIDARARAHVAPKRRWMRWVGCVDRARVFATAVSRRRRRRRRRASTCDAYACDAPRYAVTRPSSSSSPYLSITHRRRRRRRRATAVGGVRASEERCVTVCALCMRIEYARGVSSCVIFVACVFTLVAWSCADRDRDRDRDRARVRNASRFRRRAVDDERATSDGGTSDGARCRRSWYVRARERRTRRGGRGRGRGRHTRARWIVLALRVVGD